MLAQRITSFIKYYLQHKLTMIKKRNQTLDLIKGFAILLVVLGHAIQFNDLENFNSNIVFRIIYSFHMPLFMFVSGYISYRTFDGSKAKLFKRFKSLIVPFFVWFCISISISYLTFLFSGGKMPNFILGIKNIILYPDTGLWFLWILFLNYLILYLSLFLSSDKEDLYMFLFFLLINLVTRITMFDYFGLGLLSWHLFFFGFGYVFSKRNKLFRKPLNSLYLISLILFPILVSYWSRVNNPSFIEYFEFNNNIKSFINIMYRFFVPIFGIILIYVSFDKIANYSFIFKSQLLKIGTLTIEIYTAHFYFLHFTYLLGSTPLLYKIIITFFISLIGCILIQYLIKKNNFLSTLLYGH